MNTRHEISEQTQSLWTLTAAPAIWTAHFFLSYFSTAIWCGMVVGRDGHLGNIRLAIAAYTVAALTGIGINARSGLRRLRLGNASIPFDADTPEDRHRFLGFSTLLLSGLSAVATIYVALAVLFLRSCY